MVESKYCFNSGIMCFFQVYIFYFYVYNVCDIVVLFIGKVSVIVYDMWQQDGVCNIVWSVIKCVQWMCYIMY